MGTSWIQEDGSTSNITVGSTGTSLNWEIEGSTKAVNLVTTNEEDVVTTGDLTVNGADITLGDGTLAGSLSTSGNHTLTLKTGNSTTSYISIDGSSSKDILLLSKNDIYLDADGGNVTLRNLTGSSKLTILSGGGSDSGIVLYEGGTPRWSIQQDASDNTDYSLVWDYATTTAGAATKMDLDSSGNLEIAGDLSVKGNEIKDDDDVSCITFDSSGNTTIANNLTVSTATLGATTINGAITFANGETIANTTNNMIRFTSGDIAIFQIMSGGVNADSQITFQETGSSKWYIGNDATGGASDDLFTIGTSSTMGSSTKLTIDTDGDVVIAGTLDSAGLITATSGVKLGNNIIYASDGGSTITLDTSDNVTIAGDLTVSGSEVIATSFKSDDGLVFLGTGGTGTGSIVKIQSNSSIQNIIDGQGSASTGYFQVLKHGDSGHLTLLQIDEAGDTYILGDLTVNGNDIVSSSATSMTLSGANVEVKGDLTVTGNDIISSSATALTLSGANVEVKGDLTITGGDIDISGEASSITIKDNEANSLTVTQGATNICTISTADNEEQVKLITISENPSLFITGNYTLTEDIDDSGSGGVILYGLYSGSYTATRHNYIQLNNLGAAGATITDACVFRFNQNAGTHKAVDSGSAHPDIDTTDAWIKVNINDTIHYIPCYTDKS